MYALPEGWAESYDTLESYMYILRLFVALCNCNQFHTHSHKQKNKKEESSLSSSSHRVQDYKEKLSYSTHNQTGALHIIKHILSIHY